MTDDAEVSALIKAERARLAVMFILFAISRDIEAKATGDQRFSAAANSVKQIEATMVQVSDDVLINLMSVNETSNGMLTTLITTRLRAVGFQLPLYEDAPSFMAPITATVDQILRRARQHMH